VLWKVLSDNLSLAATFKFEHHTLEITSLWISVSMKAMASSGIDKTVHVYNLFNGVQYRVLHHPKALPVSFVLLSDSPLPCIVIFSTEDKSLWSYSINGQLLETQKDGDSLVSAPILVKDMGFNDFMVCLLLYLISQIYGNAGGFVIIRNLPFLQRRH